LCYVIGGNEINNEAGARVGRCLRLFLFGRIEVTTTWLIYVRLDYYYYKKDGI